MNKQKDKNNRKRKNILLKEMETSKRCKEKENDQCEEGVSGSLLLQEMKRVGRDDCGYTKQSPNTWDTKKESKTFKLSERTREIGREMERDCNI